VSSSASPLAQTCKSCTNTINLVTIVCSICPVHYNRNCFSGPCWLTTAFGVELCCLPSSSDWQYKIPQSSTTAPSIQSKRVIRAETMRQELSLGSQYCILLTRGPPLTILGRLRISQTLCANAHRPSLASARRKASSLSDNTLHNRSEEGSPFTASA
jgi:hypothetical protein